uniref:Small integral membrane protein 8 n=1 Tax=Cyprinus carpio TaxID=7962 RepID=A0A8C1RBQ9_CYPCA
MRGVIVNSVLYNICEQQLVCYCDRSSSSSSSSSMCSAQDSGRGGARQPDSGYRSPGLRGVRSTSLFRAVNPELFIKPNKPVMALGLLSLTLCVGYLGYLHAVRDNQQQLYEAVDSQGERHMRRKSSRWD